MSFATAQNKDNLNENTEREAHLKRTANYDSLSTSFGKIQLQHVIFWTENVFFRRQGKEKRFYKTY